MKILILAGGDSSEREVSLNSGAAIYESLKRLGHLVYAIDPASSKSLLTSDGKFLIGATSGGSAPITPSQTGAMALAKSLVSPAFRDIDVVFLALHGGKGENGSIQNLLELSRRPFTGSDMIGSAVAMNKAMSKRLFQSADIPTPKWQCYRTKPESIDKHLINDIESHFDYPIIVKPNDSGSTIGITKVARSAELVEAVKKALKESRDVLIEEYIPGRELTVPVLDGRVFPIVEIIPKSGLYDYEAKYTKGKSEYVVPAEVDAKIAKAVKKSASSVYEILGAAGLARIDFILADDRKFYCLELNTLPGMTELSLAPMAAKAEGIEFDELISMLVDSALSHLEQ